MTDLAGNSCCTLTDWWGLVPQGLIVTNWFQVIIVAIGIVLVAMGWVLRPRLSRLRTTMLPRSKAPAWYHLADTVADAVGAKPAHALIFNADFNASFSQVGFPRRKSIVRLGIPLLAVLDTEERVALIAHELAHGANGDPRRGLFIGSAVDTLVTWYGLLHPDRLWDDQMSGLTAVSAFLANVLLLGLSSIPWAGAYLLSHLMWRDSQRAEYLADRLAVHAAGTTAVLRLLDALHLSGTVGATLQRVSLGHGESNFFAELRGSIAALPERERERVRRVERLEESRLDATHPPTAYRIDLITSDPVTPPTVTVRAEEARALEEELAAFQPAMQAELLDRHRRSLYY